MSRRQRKEKRRKQKRLDRVPEKLQRRRDRQERPRTRRMPRWIRTGLIVVLLVVIIGAAAWVGINLLPPPSDIEPTPGEVYVLQQDMFFVFINETGDVQIDFMIGRYGAGTFEGDQPLNVSIARTFEKGEVNFTLNDPSVFYDYYGNAYYLSPDLGADSLEFLIDNIQPNMLFAYEERQFRGGTSMKGYFSLMWEYLLNSSDNDWLQTDIMNDMFTFTFDIHPENDTIPYNVPTIVHCNITFNTLTASDTNVYNFGESMILFPKHVYNDSTLIANITVHEVQRIGSSVTGDLNPTIDNETYIGFQANPITVSMSQNQSWGYTFDLNVTTFTNASFCLIDLTSPENMFFMQSGFTGNVEEQPMHFPKAQIDILTPFDDRVKMNFTDIEFRFPEIRVDNGTMSYHIPQGGFGPREYTIAIPLRLDPNSNAMRIWEDYFDGLGNFKFETIFWFFELRRLFLIE